MRERAAPFLRLAGAPGRTLAAVLALMTLVLVFVVLVFAISLWQGHRDAHEVAASRAKNAAFVTSSYAGWLMEANLQALTRLADAVGSRPIPLDGLGLPLLDDVVMALPGDVQIWVFDADGRAVMTSETLIPADIGDRQFFQDLRDGDAWSVGAFVPGEASGSRHFPIGRRIDRDGAFAGAVVSFVPVDLLSRFWRSMDVDDGSTVGLVRNDGWLVARHPPLEDTLNIFDQELFGEHLRQAPEGVYGPTVSPADGVTRVVGYQRVERFPLIATVGVPMRSLGDSFWRRAREQLLLLAPVGVALLAVSIWAVGLVRKEQSALLARDEALERNQLLFREIHHRVKNNLQTVAALVRLEGGLSQGKDDLIGRIAAMATVHEHIYDTSRFDRIDFRAYVQTLCDRLQASEGGSRTIECQLEPLTVTADQALPLGLVLNEVVSNALKHAFPQDSDGRVVVRLEIDAPNTARLSVRDNGAGYEPASGAGFGSQLIAALTKQLHADMTMQTEVGTEFVLTFPTHQAPAAATEAG